MQSAKAKFQPAKAPLEQQEEHKAPVSAVQAGKAKFQAGTGAAPATAAMAKPPETAAKPQETAAKPHEAAAKPPETAQLSAVQAARARLEHSGAGPARVPDQAGGPSEAGGKVAKLASKFNKEA